MRISLFIKKPADLSGDSVMEKHRVTVTILGRKFSLRTDSKPEAIAEAADVINRKSEDLKRSSVTENTEDLSMLLNLVLAHELLSARRKLAGKSLPEASSDEKWELKQIDTAVTLLLEMLADAVD